MFRKTLFCFYILFGLLNSTIASCTFGQYYFSPLECLFCPKNTYCPNQNGCPNRCSDCPLDLKSDYTGAFECTNSSTSSCPIGTGKANGEGCYPCEGGGYNTYGNQTWCGCSGGRFYYIGLCPGGRDCNSGGNFCSSCYGGYALPNANISSTSYMSKCNPCPENTTTTFESTTPSKYLSYACTNNLTESCPSKSGLYENLDGGCIECAGGSSNNDAKLYCNCGYGKFYSVSLACRDCIQDTYCNGEDMCQNNCLICPSGTFATNSRATACTNSYTTRCPDGSATYSDPNIFGCYKVCPSGKYYFNKHITIFFRNVIGNFKKFRLRVYYYKRRPKLLTLSSRYIPRRYGVDLSAVYR